MAYEDDRAYITSYAIFIVAIPVISHTILPVQDKTFLKKSEDLF